MKKYIYSLFMSLSLLAMGSCSTDSETLSSSISPDSKTNYRFVVNVTKDNTRANEKTGWEKGDVISGQVEGYTWVDLTYQGDDYWDVYIRAYDVEKDTCKIHAFYGNSADQYLYTDEGEFLRSNGTIFINLNMNKRPNAKITVKGVDEDYRVANLNTVNNFWSSWDFFEADTLKNVEPTEYDKQTQTAVFYGVVAPTNDQTKILLYNSDGVGYSRTYNKVMKGGESIVLNGPNSSEGNLWTKHTLVKNITLNETRVNTFIDETFDLKATVEPADADNNKLKWYSSDESIASVGNHGHVTVNGIGEALITVETEDGTQSTNCAVVSRSHASLTLDNLVCANGNGVFEANFTCNYDGTICLKKLYLKHSGNDKVYVLSNVTDGELGDNVLKYKYNVTLNFNNLPSAVYYLWADYTCNGKTYSIQCTNRYVAP